MIRYFYLAVSVLLLLISFTRPRQHSSSDFDWAGLAFLFDCYAWLFLFCIAIFNPMIGVAIYYLLKGLFFSLKQKNIRAGSSELLVSVVVSIALYRFNKWILGELF